ncbi:MAG TPA: hypothetical protein VMW56_12265 [Candidatus Margulisiibacteriota bacterium]|nr:hypothetical protein [Candidatus Margulisiibacteriota bacterium]
MQEGIQWLDRVVALLGFNPFVYLAVAVGGMSVWVWCTMVGSFALTGRAMWIRRASLVVAVLGAVLFTYTARSLR